MIFDDSKKLVGFDNTKNYHTFNKNEKLLAHADEFNNKNVILLGDSLHV